MQNTTQTWHPEAERPKREGEIPALIVVWCAEDHRRVGEVALVPKGSEPRTLGREGTLTWVQQRPGANLPCTAVPDPRISRQQVRFENETGDIIATNIGKLPLKLNGLPITSSTVKDGDLLEIGDRLMLLVAQRPPELPGAVPTRQRFGQPGPIGMVGESPAAWALREQVAFVAGRKAHVLVIGPSGTGKELVANALHRLSDRGTKPLISRSAATIPESLADAELFGNLAGYPNPQMAARRGLIGEADGSSLFLDEFGELPIELQARLLRVLDAGEYTRLGDARPRTADIRLIAATNRDPATLKHDVVARFSLRIDLPGLQARKEDIPLLALHLLRRVAENDPLVAKRLYPDGDYRLGPRIHMRMVRRLMWHAYTTHVRELEALLWRAIGNATDGPLDLPGSLDLGMRPEPESPSGPPTPAPGGPTPPHLLDPAVIQEALDRHGGRQADVWKELGLSSRHVLARLIKKHDLRVDRK